MIQPTDRPIDHGRVAGASRGSAARAALWLLACGLCGLGGVAQGQTVSPPATNLSSGNYLYWGNPSITANSGFTVSGSAAVGFMASGSIVLGPGFQATAGSAGTVFQASIASAPPAPVLGSMSQSSALQGASVPVTLTGSNFVTGGSTVSSSNTGVTVSNVVVVNANQITATLAIGASATGTANITVATAGGTSGAFVFTVNQQPAPAYTFAPLQASMTVAPGGVATYMVAAQPAGYTGTITLGQPWPVDTPPQTVTCDGYPGWVSSDMTVIAEGTTPDGSAALLYVTTDSNIQLNGCNSQSYTINYRASGSNPTISSQQIHMHLTVGIAPSFTVSAIPLSQTALSQTYVVTAQSPNISGPVALSLNAGSCAYQIGNPVLTLPTGATGTAPVVGTATFSVGTFGCPAGTTTSLTFTGTATGGAAATATV